MSLLLKLRSREDFSQLLKTVVGYLIFSIVVRGERDIIRFCPVWPQDLGVWILHSYKYIDSIYEIYSFTLYIKLCLFVKPMRKFVTLSITDYLYHILCSY